MSASPTSKFAGSTEAHQAGWFSRRHKTGEAHQRARQTRDEKMSMSCKAWRERQKQKKGS